MYSTRVLLYISTALCQLGGSQIIVPGSNVYIQCPMSGGKVQEYSTTVLCIYSGLYVRREGLRV